jgi:hypothetical protein
VPQKRSAGALSVSGVPWAMLAKITKQWPSQGLWRMRATRRLDQLRQAQKETVGLSVGTRGSPIKGARVDDKPTLASQGIDKNHRPPGAQRWRLTCATTGHAKTLTSPPPLATAHRMNSASWTELSVGSEYLVENRAACRG